MHVCVYVNICTCMYIYIYACTHACIHAPLVRFSAFSMCVSTYIHTHTHIHTYIHTYIQAEDSLALLQQEDSDSDTEPTLISDSRPTRGDTQTNSQHRFDQFKTDKDIFGLVHAHTGFTAGIRPGRTEEESQSISESMESHISSAILADSNLSRNGHSQTGQIQRGMSQNGQKKQRDLGAALIQNDVSESESVIEIEGENANKNEKGELIVSSVVKELGVRCDMCVCVCVYVCV
jgi:hypothetical protein